MIHAVLEDPPRSQIAHINALKRLPTVSCTLKLLKRAFPVRSSIWKPPFQTFVWPATRKRRHWGVSGYLLETMPKRKLVFHSFLALAAAVGFLSSWFFAAAQNTKRPWMNPNLSPEERADLVLKQLTLDEKIALLHGNGMAHAPHWRCRSPLSPTAAPVMLRASSASAFPPLVISDAAYGVRDSGANGRYSTALPSSLGAASSWDTESACAFGTVIGSELRAQGFNMTLGGGVDLAREPRNGRTFEYAGEDPLLAGTIVGNLMKCEQAQHVVGDIKHYAMNDQETGRNFVNAVISKRGMQESDLLAFHIAISIANPGAVMCSYNRVNGDYDCENS